MSLSDYLREALIQDLESVAPGLTVSGAEVSGLQKLQDIMTEAKEKVSPTL